MISEFHMYRCYMAYSITLWDSMYIHFVDLLTWCPLACILLLPSKSWYADNSLFPWQILEPKSTKIRKIWHSAVFTWKQDFVTAICYCPSSRLANEWKSFSFWKSLIIHLQANPHVYIHIYTLFVHIPCRFDIFFFRLAEEEIFFQKFLFLILNLWNFLESLQNLICFICATNRKLMQPHRLEWDSAVTDQVIIGANMFTYEAMKMIVLIRQMFVLYRRKFNIWVWTSVPTWPKPIAAINLGGSVERKYAVRGSGDKLVTRKKEKGSNKLVAERETSWSHSSREGSIRALILKE